MTPMEAAVKVRDALVARYGPAETTDLMLWDAEKSAEMGYGNGEATLVWEGAPLHDWAVEVSMTSPVLSLPGILAEPYNGHILNFYTN